MFSQVSYVIAVTATGSPSISLWSSVLPNVPLPETLRQALSPLEDSTTAERFANAVAHGAVFPSTSALFCKEAGLICDENFQISAYSTPASKRGENQVKAPGIKSINDLQFDFFLEEDLVKGASMKLSENLHDPIPMRPFLPRMVADSLPALTTANLPKLRQTFNIADKTSMSTMMGTATYLCENPALPGEQFDCPATLSAMAQFVVSQLGSNVEALSTSGAPATAPANQAPVQIVDFTKRSLAEGEHILICHSLMFPSALYYCHHVTGTKVVQASLLGADESLIQAVGICHMDTSLWATEHPAFAALNIPRGAEACHWASENDIVWVQNATQ